MKRTKTPVKLRKLSGVLLYSAIGVFLYSVFVITLLGRHIDIFSLIFLLLALLAGFLFINYFLWKCPKCKRRLALPPTLCDYFESILFIAVVLAASPLASLLFIFFAFRRFQIYNLKSTTTFNHNEYFTNIHVCRHCGIRFSDNLVFED